MANDGVAVKSKIGKEMVNLRSDINCRMVICHDDVEIAVLLSNYRGDRSGDEVNGLVINGYDDADLAQSTPLYVSFAGGGRVQPAYDSINS